MRFSLLFACAIACGSPTPAPPFPRTQVVEAATFSVTASSIEVRVVKRWQGREATGRAILHGHTLGYAEMSALVGIAGTRAWLELAANGAAQEKYEVLRRALDELGTEYRYRDGGGRMRRSIVDDTGPPLLFAKALAESGDFAGATERADKMLRSRLQAYVQRFRGAID